MSIEQGSLYVVATPIGNLGDISRRALDTLKAVDCIAAEDTRRTGQLLAEFGIRKPLVSLHEHNEAQRSQAVLERLLVGESVALVSDAGTPLISDPGYRLVRDARMADIPVVPIPGPSALIAALSASGLPTDRFVFEGFLPARASARRARLEALSRERRTLVFYESTHRIVTMLSDLAEIFGAGREAVLAREMTKLHEELRAGELKELVEWLEATPEKQRGEFVVAVRGAEDGRDPVASDALARRLVDALLAELSVKQAARVAAQALGASRNELYRLALELSATRRDRNEQ